MTEWAITKQEVYWHLNKRVTSKATKKLLRACLERIEVLERANSSFGNSMDEFVGKLPGILSTEIDRISNVQELHVTPPKELGECND